MRTAGQGLSFESVRLEDRPWFPYLCTEVEHWQWETRGDAHFNFWAVLGGEGTLTCSGRTFRLQPGLFFIFQPGQGISAAHYAGERVTRFSAHFHPLAGGSVLKEVEGFPVLGARVASLPLLRRQIDRIMRLAFLRSDEVAVAGQFYDLLVQTCSGGEEPRDRLLDARIAEAVRRFREDPAKIDSIDGLASGLNWSRSHFDREFRRQVGVPPKRFLLECRMIHARRMLEGSRLRVSEIAERLGYRDIYFFSRQFKNRFGRSPMNYRRELQG